MGGVLVVSILMLVLLCLKGFMSRETPPLIECLFICGSLGR